MNESKPQFHSLGARPGKLRFAQMLDAERAAGQLNGFEPVTNASNRPAADRRYQARPTMHPMNFPFSSRFQVT